MVTKMQVENTLGRGWNKLPKNRTDAKLKIFERLLAMRKLVNDEYVLYQDRLIGDYFVPNSKIRDFCKTALVAVLSCTLCLADAVSKVHLQYRCHKKTFWWFYLKTEGIHLTTKEAHQLQRFRQTWEFRYPLSRSYFFTYQLLTVSYLQSRPFTNEQFLWNW